VTDVVVIGGGHNGLACAAYLARAGRSVIVLEKRDSVGGCASTVDAIGARVNICNCDHTMVLASGIIDELDLAAYGLRYLSVDPVTVAVGWGQEPVFVQWRDIGRTLDGLAAIDPAVARAYRRYLDAALPSARLVLAVQGSRPTTRDIVATAARHRLRGTRSVLAWARRSLLDVLGSFGLPSWMIAAAHTGGPAVWGLPPDHPGTGLGALGLAMRHLVGVGRPVGGSGALPDALAAYVRAHGGTIVTSAEVSGLVIEAGRVRGVRLADGAQVGADTVVAATDPQTVMGDWARRWPTAEQNGYESKVDAVVASLPRFHAVPEQVNGIATTLVCPEPEQMVRHLDRVSDPPMFLVNTPSVLDESMRPSPDSHLLSVEVLWTPYALRGGWDGSPQPWRWMEQLASICAPGLLEGVRDWRVMTPPDYEREFSLRRGYAPSFPGGVVDALLGRRRELTRYTTDVPGLYLTGAGTFPGAGVWGVSGRNAAATITRSAASVR